MRCMYNNYSYSFFSKEFIDDLHIIQTLKYEIPTTGLYTKLLQASKRKTITLRLTQLFDIF